MIRIRSLKEGFRRAGLAHSVEATEYPDERFTADELEQLLNEPLLAVEVIPNDSDKSGEADKAKDSGEAAKDESDAKADKQAKKSAK